MGRRLSGGIRHIDMTARARPSCAILVLNWNGIAHLQHLLPSLRAAVAGAPERVPIVVVDNRSTQPDADWVRREFPDVELVLAPKNDYLYSLNAVVASRSEDVVVILNNDMRVDEGFLQPLLRHFGDETVFAATANVFDWEGTRMTTGQRRIRHRRAWFYQWWVRGVDVPTYTLDAGGGCAAFRRAYFTELGGFDRLYHPAYFEDIDLSYRAWRRGWRTIYEPRSIMYHRVGATLTTPDRESRTRRLLTRNHALCVLKNVGGWATATACLALMPSRIAKAWIRGDRDGAAGLLAAISRVPSALVARARQPRPRVSSCEIDALVASAAPSPSVDGSRAEGSAPTPVPVGTGQVPWTL
jgi:GT2 family glycosyltransferase